MSEDLTEFMKNSAEYHQKLFEMAQQCAAATTLQGLILKEVLAWVYRQEPDPRQSIMVLQAGILRQIASAPGPATEELRATALQFFEVLAMSFPETSEDEFASVSTFTQ